MNRAADDPSIFIRSMATRGALGGLAKATLECIHVLDCAGFDSIVIETVGVGQAEVDVVRSADTCVVVLVPGMGDSVQIIKAGLMEIADLFIINKADRDGALTLEKDLFTLLSLVELSAEDWRPRVVKTIATEGTGTEQVVQAAREHLEWLEQSPKGHARRLRVVAHTIASMAAEWITQRALLGREGTIESLAKQCIARSKTPLQAVEELVNEIES
jgi:LAO/AO transport system kinase